MKARCKHCGEKFELTKEEKELHSDGFIELPNCCEECAFMQEDSMYLDEQNFSDADSGL